MKKAFTIALLGATLPLSASLIASEKPWDQSFSLGLNIAKGNTESTQVATSYDGLKRFDQAELQLKASVNFGEDDTNNTKTKTTDNYFAEANFRRDFSKHFYWLLNSSYTVDNIADLDYRLNVGPGLGYRLMDTHKTNMDLEAGLAYFGQKYDNTPKDSGLGYRVAEKWNYKLSDKSKLWQSAEIVGDTDEGDNYVIKGEIGVSSALAGALSLKSTVSDTYTNDPKAGKKKNDVTIMTTLVYSF
jgi:putative salt-induced outer membrane protein